MDILTENLKTFCSINDQLCDNSIEDLDRIGFKTHINLIEASTKYPDYKIISDEQVKFLLNKYSLCRTYADNYLGNLPKEKFNDINKFMSKYNHYIIYHHRNMFRSSKYYSYKDRKEAINKFNTLKVSNRNKIFSTIELSLISNSEKIFDIKHISSDIKDVVVLAKPLANLYYYDASDYSDGWYGGQTEDYNIIITRW